MKKIKGISLIVLVVTIIAMIIIAGAIILSLSNTNVIDQAEYARERHNITVLEENLRLEKQNILLEKHGTVKDEDIKIETILNVAEEDAINIATANSIPANMPAGKYYILPPEKYIDATSTSPEISEDTLKNVYVINDEFKVYYVIEGIKGEAKKEPTDQKYLLFSHDESTLTSIFKGMNPDYLMDNGYYGEGNYVITDLVIPAVVKNDSGEDSVVIGASGMMDGVEYSKSEVFTIKTLSLPETMKSIGMYAFENWTGLNTIDIPSNITSIAPFAFSKCTNLTTITLPKGLTRLSGPVFPNCTSLTTVTLPEGFLGFTGPVFQNCTNLTEVYFPSTININSGGFFSGVKDITVYINKYKNECSTDWLPPASWGASSVTLIFKAEPEESKFFRYTGILDRVTYIAAIINGFKEDYKISEGVYGEGDQIITDLIIPEKCVIDSNIMPVVSISSTAFMNNQSIETVVIPKTIEAIGSGAFYGCTNLTTVTLSEGLKTIDSSAFVNCPKLTKIEIPSTVITMRYGVFDRCSSDLKIYVDKYESECSEWPSGWYGNATVIYKSAQ